MTPRHTAACGLLVATLLSAQLAVAAPIARPAPKPHVTPEGVAGSRRLVVRVVDGDTLVLDGGERVRLIGVDTPETVHPNKPVEYFGKEASAFTRRIATGQAVQLEFDPANITRGHRDRYGRTLAYVYLADGRMLNREIVRQGYGHAYTRFPFRYLDDLRAAEREARAQHRGLWAP